MKTNFEISARAAMQIGRDNFSSAEGAIIELIKNSYDADSHISYVYFFIPLGGKIYSQISKEDFSELKEKANLHNINLFNYYIEKEDGFYLDDKNQELLEKKIKEFSFIYILDNGDGMDKGVIEKHWMTIATDNKKKTVTSSRLGRVRTGEKGIGRFALDRLGSIGEMVTSNINSNKNCIVWDVNWEDFEKEGILLSEVEADLKEGNFLFKEYIKDELGHISDKIDFYDFNNGTLLKIKKLRDLWNEEKIHNLRNSLDNLIPPSGIEKFNIFINGNSFDEIDITKLTHDNYDYKIICNFTGDKFYFQINRKEFDNSKIDFNILNSTIPYRKENFNEYRFFEEIGHFLPGKEINEVKKIGPFEFEMYFSKRQMPGKDEVKKYFYKTFVSEERKSWLKRFSGVKIFRDNFRVRPYGELGTSWDWLGLGDRALKDPSAASRAKKWRVNPDNISGILKISRNTNYELLDKSNREGLIENKYYYLLLEVLTSIIKKFEDDRSILLNMFLNAYSENNPVEEAIQKTEESIKKRNESDKNEEDLKKERESWSKEKYEEEYGKKEEEAKNAQYSYQFEKEEKEKIIDEKKLLNTLATKGVVFNSLQHEIKENKNEVNSWLAFLNKFIDNNLKKDNFLNEKNYNNPFIIFDTIKKHFTKLSEWVEISLTSTRKDRRYTKNVILSDYFDYFNRNWAVFFEKRGINFSFDKDNKSLFLKCFELDLDTIFQNLIINSGEAFEKKHNGNRKISIDFYEDGDYLFIVYKDNGPGLDREKIKNIYDIFEADFTTKKDGTGLGMWLLRITMESFTDSKYILIEGEDGFGIKLQFKRQIYA